MEFQFLLDLDASVYGKVVCEVSPLFKTSKVEAQREGWVEGMQRDLREVVGISDMALIREGSGSGSK